MSDDKNRLGATRAEWNVFAKTLRLGPHLLPAVARTDAAVSPKSALKAGHLGKIPSRYTAQREVVGIPDWSAHRASLEDVRKWREEPDYSICLIMRATVGLDVDVQDPDLCASVVDVAEQLVGKAPTRWRANSSKVLLLYRLDREYSVDELPKRVLSFPEGTGRPGDKIELLGPGQQAVVAGTHPSGARIEWDGLPASWEELPVITAEQAAELMQGLQSVWPGAKSQLSGGGTIAPVTDPAVLAHLRGSVDPVVPWLAEQGWVRGESADGKVYVRCPWEHEHSSEGDQTETVYLPLGYRDVAVRGFQCLHAHCSERKARDFLREIGYDDPAGDFDVLDGEGEVDDVAALEALVGELTDEERIDLRQGQAMSHPSLGAVSVDGCAAFDPFEPQGEMPIEERRIAKGVNAGQRPALPDLFDALWSRPDLCGFRLSWDSLLGRPTILWRDRWESWVAAGAVGAVPWEPVTDATYTRISALSTRPASRGGLGFVYCAPELVRARLQGLAGPPQDGETPPRGGECWGRWRDSGVEHGHRLAAGWDGVPRVETFLSRYLSVEDSEYTRAVSEYLMTALAGRMMYVEQCSAARDYYSGVKVDMAVVLVGHQGQGKTQVNEALVWDRPERIASVSFDRIGSADLAREMRGSSVYHMGELRGLSDAKLETVKDWLTRRWDTWVEKYQSTAMSYPRRGVFVGDTNRDDFLGDLTGNRRWLPVTVVGQADVEALVRDRDQIWGEAVVRWRESGVAWQRADELGHQGREDYQAEVPYHEEILAWLMSPLDGLEGPKGACNWMAPEGISTGYILRHVLGDKGGSAYGTRAAQMKIAEILRHLGAERRQVGADRLKRFVFDQAPGAPRRDRFGPEFRAALEAKGNKTRH